MRRSAKSISPLIRRYSTEPPVKGRSSWACIPAVVTIATVASESGRGAIHGWGSISGRGRLSRFLAMSGCMSEVRTMGRLQ